jgi:uncharacterized protein YegL
VKDSRDSRYSRYSRDSHTSRVEGALHVYLLLDTSASMTGAPLESLKQGVSLLHSTLATRSNRPVNLATISYDSFAMLIRPLQSAKDEFSLPDLVPGGSSCLGAAFRFLDRTMEAGERPFLYIFSDGGEPTDDWEEALASIRARVERIIGLACGLRADSQALLLFCDEVYTLRDLTPEVVFSTFRTYVR